MVNTMNSRIKAEFARALRLFRYERASSGVFFPAQKVAFGGFFELEGSGGEEAFGKNTVTLTYLDDILSKYFNNGSVPTAFYIAPFTNNVTPSSSISAATFASTLNEYTGYTQSTRVAWTPNGNSTAQSMSNSNAPAEFTIGASSVTITGAGLLTAGAKGAPTGVCVAAALFDVPNTMNAGSTIKIKYTLGATAA